MPSGSANNPPNIQNGLVGNLKINNFDNGQKAGPTSFWRGDGHWAFAFTPEIAQTNQNGAIGPLNLYPGAFPTSIMVMAAFYMETTTVDGAATTSWQLTATNTDDSGISISSNIGNAVTGSSHTLNQGSFVVRVLAGTVPTVSVTSSGSAATSKYALYISAQQIG